MILRLGTRGSALARWQAGFVAGKLRSAGHTVEVVFIQTSGDARTDVPLAAVAGKGVFVREIESELLAGSIDLAVHSAKDLPSVDVPGLMLAAFCERADARDALVSRYRSINDLPRNATVATSAPRRIAQLLHRRPDLRPIPIRGNVDTRLRKLDEGSADALVLACAGLDRLGRESVISERISEEILLPQVGQGCVAVQCRAGDTDLIEQVREICDHEPTRLAVTAERQFLALLGGGCTAPVAGHAFFAGDRGVMAGLVAAPNGSRLVYAAGTVTLPDTTLPQRIYDRLLEQGARELMPPPDAP
ncbi:MAG: hydroxymethylbilane synthase [Capsulimonadales bacterium]|nr:hydroxymethylbilane synthase [Capsulimonadales bacterium]